MLTDASSRSRLPKKEALVWVPSSSSPAKALASVHQAGSSPKPRAHMILSSRVRPVKCGSDEHLGSHADEEFCEERRSRNTRASLAGGKPLLSVRLGSLSRRAEMISGPQKARLQEDCSGRFPLGGVHSLACSGRRMEWFFVFNS